MFAPRRAAAAAAALLAAVALTLPGAAQAGQPPAMHLGLHAAGGYQVAVSGFGQTVGLSVARPRPSRHAGASTTYIARGKLGADTIEAGFGAFGQLSMRFQPSGKVVYGKRQQGCIGPDRTTTRFGQFVGSLRFRGEDGYVSVQTHRVKGKIRTPDSLQCTGAEAGPAGTTQGGEAAGQGKRTTLRAGFRLGLHDLSLEASSARAGHARYVAVSEQSQGQIAIYRSAYVQASPLTFATDSALSFASVSPPPPFSGTGTLRRAANGTRSWAGSLAVSFLGAADVPLAGPQFRTALSRSW
jgi:hypothetical protein